MIYGAVEKSSCFNIFWATAWRNRAGFLNGCGQVVEFLRRKWGKEVDYRLKQEHWAFTRNRIAVRFEY